MQHQNHEIVDLTSNLSDEKLSKELIAPCSGKKRRILKIEPDVMQAHENSNEHSSVVRKAQSNYPSFTANSVKCEKPQKSDSGTQNTHVNSAQLHDWAAQKGDAGSISQKHKGVQSSPAPCVDEETRGSDFLIQVQEKLNAAEYKDFVDFMKALKSKAMKIGHVLQSIARLFSGPERLPLRKRFKDYIPAKYHCLYEKYVETNDETVILKIE
ncbi:hypothetical protein L1049_004767 [Liquidambar formosana]|uniref:Uncharacterized protein n=1 Tax=Liquidambar formosana TaxID=63359 RepID=A0AAP0X0M5_LIQFO